MITGMCLPWPVSSERSFSGSPSTTIRSAKAPGATRADPALPAAAASRRCIVAMRITSIGRQHAAADDELLRLVAVHLAQQVGAEGHGQPGLAHDLQRSRVPARRTVSILATDSGGEAERRALVRQLLVGDQRRAGDGAASAANRAVAAWIRLQCSRLRARRIRRRGGWPRRCRDARRHRSAGVRGLLDRGADLLAREAEKWIGSVGEATPPLAMILMKSAPPLISSRQARRTSATPSHDAPERAERGAGQSVSRGVVAAAEVAVPAGLATAPCREMTRRGAVEDAPPPAPSRSPWSAPPRSRTVVKPRISMPRMIRAAREATRHRAASRSAPRLAIAGDHMHMRVDQARHQRAAAQVDADALARHLLPDLPDHAALDQDLMGAGGSGLEPSTMRALMKSVLATGVSGRSGGAFVRAQARSPGAIRQAGRLWAESQLCNFLQCGIELPDVCPGRSRADAAIAGQQTAKSRSAGFLPKINLACSKSLKTSTVRFALPLRVPDEAPPSWEAGGRTADKNRGGSGHVPWDEGNASDPGGRGRLHDRSRPLGGARARGIPCPGPGQGSQLGHRAHCP